jgi:transposase-like protein
VLRRRCTAVSATRQRSSATVWLYHRFPLSLREVPEMMAQRGVVVSHETVR